MRIDNLFKDFQKELKAIDADLKESQTRIMNSATQAAKTHVVKNTPVGVYGSDVSFTTKDGKEVKFHTKAKVGGHLRKSWQLSRTRFSGKNVERDLFNIADYAIFVNNGHRIVNKSGETIGWVPGVFVLEKGITHYEENLPLIFDAELERVRKKHDL